MSFVNPGNAIHLCLEYIGERNNISIHGREVIFSTMKERIYKNPMYYGYHDNCEREIDFSLIEKAWHQIFDICQKFQDIWSSEIIRNMKGLTQTPMIADIVGLKDNTIHIIELKVRTSKRHSTIRKNRQESRRQVLATCKFLREAGIKQPIIGWDYTIHYGSLHFAEFTKILDIPAS